MDTAILPSTLILTVLLAVGLLFFIRASTKDRTQTVKLLSRQSEASLMPKLQQYLQARSYRVTAVDQQQNQVTFEGFVQPSLFLAVFLTLLATVGTLCLALVLGQLFPKVSVAALGLVLVAPAAGLFYWQKAGRNERVVLKLEPNQDKQKSPSYITVVAHRDELLELQKALQLEPGE